MKVCAVPGCVDPSPVLHYFPHPEKDYVRFVKWVEVVGSEKLKSFTPLSVYKSYRICNKHFMASDVSRNNRLLKSNKTIIPRLFLPESKRKYYKM